MKCPISTELTHLSCYEAFYGVGQHHRNGEHHSSHIHQVIAVTVVLQNVTWNAIAHFQRHHRHHQLIIITAVLQLNSVRQKSSPQKLFAKRSLGLTRSCSTTRSCLLLSLKRLTHVGDYELCLYVRRTTISKFNYNIIRLLYCTRYGSRNKQTGTSKNTTNEKEKNNDSSTLHINYVAF